VNPAVVPYREFLAAKQRSAAAAGPVVDSGVVHPLLHGWQELIVRWAVWAGRAAVWADTGLGKTLIQLEWARLSGRRVLLVAPLAVCEQTVAEARRIGITTRYVRDDTAAAGPGIWVTNYEMTSRFDPAGLDAVVLDESSVLKDVTSKTRDRLIAQFAGVPRRLACTATPAPNDVTELANHAEFLGTATRREMLATYFVHDADGWRVKGHARGPMFIWMATWALAIRHPSDLGWPDTGYMLPPLRVIPHVLDDASDVIPEGQLFATDLGGVSGRARTRAATVHDRCARAAQLTQAEPAEPWVLWCGLNAEATTLARLVPGAVNLHGALPPEAKAAIVRDFSGGRIRVLVTKPPIAAFGLNWQHCARMAFVGLSDSYESYYQAIRRCHRYGQTRAVHAHVIVSGLEAQIAANVARKQQQASALTDALVAQMRAAATWRTP
jgi:Helicase conserved C-terminal domain